MLATPYVISFQSSRAHARGLCRDLLATAFLVLFFSASGYTQSMSTEYDYNSLATVSLLESEIECTAEGEDEFCLVVTRPDGTGLADLQYPVEAINLAKPEFGSLLLGRHSGDFGWFVYDLSESRYVASPVDQPEALQIWREHGLSTPEIVDALQFVSGVPAAPRATDSFSLLRSAFAALAAVVLFVSIAAIVALAIYRYRRRNRLSVDRVDQIDAWLWRAIGLGASAWLCLLIAVFV